MLPVQTVRILNGTCSRPTFLLMIFVDHFRLSSRHVSRNCAPRRSFSQDQGRRAGMESRRIVILTGAGISKESGIDTRSQEHTTALQSLMSNAYAAFCQKT